MMKITDFYMFNISWLTFSFLLSLAKKILQRQRKNHLLSSCDHTRLSCLTADPRLLCSSHLWQISYTRGRGRGGDPSAPLAGKDAAWLFHLNPSYPGPAIVASKMFKNKTKKTKFYAIIRCSHFDVRILHRFKIAAIFLCFKAVKAWSKPDPVLTVRIWIRRQMYGSAT